MAAVGTILSVAQTLFAALESPMLKQICSILGYKSELKNLKNTVLTVRAVLLDAEARQDGELSNAARDWIEKLKYAVYDADDLLDEFTTIAEQKQLLEGGAISKEVRAFFSCFNQLGMAYTMSRGIKKVRKQLDAIARDHAQFGLGLPINEPIRRRNKETCSYVYEQNIIGRDDDKKALIDMLLDPHVEGNVSFVTIVGIGGLGKTALAQLVYNDEVVKKEFPLRMWVCVSDQNPKHLDIKAVLGKILASATKENPKSSELDLVQHQLRKELEGKRYLLVFDDVWIEDRDQCLQLGEFLLVGARGSRVLVTTRSLKTAKVIGNGSTHELKGLSEEKSWHLFERLAFDQGQGDLNPDLVEIGKKIVKKCANVPLAIRMTGTLLYGQSKAEWQAIQRKGLAKTRQDGDDITHVLKLSYYHLDTYLKSCFSFCSIFPKDYVMNKMKLITLWMAQGYVEPLDEGQGIYDAGEEYFAILVRRCFIQDVKIDEYGEIVSCKMHDLMHDIAQEVAGDEICVEYDTTSKINGKTRHVFDVKNDYGQSSLPHSKIRTCLQWQQRDAQLMDDIVRKWKYMRALELISTEIKEFPCAIGRLIYLRYLNLSSNWDLERLPEEITKLHNLQTLLLRDCTALIEPPSDLSKLSKLRVLDMEGCNSLTYMPRGLDRLTGLCILPLFIAGAVKSTKEKQGVGKLEDIAALNDLKGGLTIKIHSNEKIYDKGGYIKNKEHLSWIVLRWLHDDEKNENKVVSDKVIAEELQPHPNVKVLSLVGYGDVEKPSWAIDDKFQTSLPNLVSLTIYNCKGLEDLPMLGRLRVLKSLYIWDLLNLEYTEKGSSSSYDVYEGNSGTGLFPSLEVLGLLDLPKLKGWWKGDAHMNGDDDENSNMPISFPRLYSLSIRECPLLTSMPLCPTVEILRLKGWNERLEIMKIKSGRKGGGGVTEGDGQVVDMSAFKLRYVHTHDMGCLLKSLPIPAAFQFLTTLFIKEDIKVENLREVEDVFRSCSSSLQSLDIFKCRKLRSISGVLEHLTSLQKLSIFIESDIMNDDIIRCRLEEENEVAWSALQNCLHKLEINYIPKGIRHLISLQTLVLTDCRNMERIPDFISCLSSLQSLCLCLTSEELRQRCKSTDGPDWPKIQHIPIFKFN